MTSFSLVLGGPLYGLYLRCRLVQPPIGLVNRRITWCFLGTTPFILLPVLLSHTVLLSGRIADHIRHEGASLLQFRREIALLVRARQARAVASRKAGPRQTSS